MAFPRHTVAAVKERSDIVQIIGEKVALLPAGSNFKGLCPFHAEKTPSFMVNPRKGMFHCFGCGAGGSVVDFLMAYERLSFPEAVRALATRVGLALEEEEREAEPDRGAEVLAAAQAYYHDLLLTRPEGETARRYLAQRGVEEPSWRAFGLGFALDDWQGFTAHAQRLGFAVDDLVASGLVRLGQSGRPYDLLRGRVVFPIHDARGRCIAFGGRAIEPLQEPKYLNTPETRYYQKSRVLFGLAEGLETLRRERRAILVEGYLDVVRLHEHGFAGAVATCGTALTGDHAELLERYADAVTLVFDGDAAGIKAALRSAPLLLNRRLEARVTTLPDGLDPDDFVVQRGPEAFSEQLTQAAPLLEYLVVQTLRRHGDTVAGREKALAELAPLLAEIRQPVARDLTVRHVADLVGVRADHVLRLLKPRAGRRGAAPEGAPDEEAAPRADRHQRLFLQLLLREPALLPMARAALPPEHLSDPALRRLYEKLLRFAPEELSQTSPEELGDLLPDVAPTLRSLLVEGSVHVNAVGDVRRQVFYEALTIMHGEKARLWRQFQQAAGTDQEELAARRYFKVRDRLKGVRSCRDVEVTLPPDLLPTASPAS